MINKPTVVLLSGGQDSTTCLFWALQNFDDEVLALNILYGQRHIVEAQAARKIANIAGVDLHEIHADQIFKALGNSGLVETNSDISSSHKTDSSLPASFVPGRNIMFLTIAAAWAYSRGINDIVTGVCQTDYSGYPDCRDNTIKSVQVALSLGLAKDIIIHTPLMWMTKTETVLIAKNDLVSSCWKALAYSHTCYEGKIPPCSKCPACKLRAKGFEGAGLVDPLIERLNKK
jgi:7-cyano-7-deazaguanine synthase